MKLIIRKHNLRAKFCPFPDVRKKRRLCVYQQKLEAQTGSGLSRRRVGLKQENSRTGNKKFQKIWKPFLGGSVLCARNT